MDQKQSSESARISQVRTTLAQDGKTAAISFSVSMQDAYPFYVVYEVTEEEYNSGMRLSGLLARDENGEQRQPRITLCAKKKDYTLSLSRTGKRCLFYLARYEAEGKAYYILNQEQENVSDLMKILPTVRCRLIGYETIRTGLLGRAHPTDQIAVLMFDGDTPVQGAFLVYRLRNGGRDARRFGIDLVKFWRKEVRIRIKKTEKVEILPPEDNAFRLVIS
ncbi:MAG: hypothetical protein LUF35_08745 [Lachnospiraceae bacterium]|nr:hypothetical protein [Lachnospiraceae bacterium]